MTTHTSDHDPLDESERALARIVRALPAGDPPAALDALILKASSDALARPNRRRLAWLSATGSLWGIGSAAAAVLVLGIAWQRMNPPMMSLPASSPVPVAEDIRSDASQPVEFKQESPRQFDNSPPPSPPAAPAVARLGVTPPAPMVSAEPTQAAVPNDALDEHVAQRELQAPAVGQLGGAAADAPVLAAQAASSNAMAKAVSAERDQATTRSEVDARVRVADDKRLYPESWLLKIHARLKDHDVEGARASLRQFVAEYPQQPVPDDLKFLLLE